MEQCASFLLLQHAGETGVNQSNRAINSLPFATNFSSNADLALKWGFEYCFFPILQGVSQKSCFDPLLVLWLSGLQVGARPTDDILLTNCLPREKCLQTDAFSKFMFGKTCPIRKQRDKQRENKRENENIQRK